MSKLDDLIAELCPEGVEYKPLSEITHLTAGDRITKSMMRDDFEYPVMSSGAKTSGNYTNYNYSHSIAIPRVGAAGLVIFLLPVSLSQPPEIFRCFATILHNFALISPFTS